MPNTIDNPVTVAAMPSPSLAMSQGAPPPPPPPPPGMSGAAITPLFTKKIAEGGELDAADQKKFMSLVHAHHTAIHSFFEKELALLLSTNKTESTQKSLETTRSEIATVQWTLMDLGKKYSHANIDLEKFLTSLDTSNLAKLKNPDERTETKKSILKPGLNNLIPVVKRLDTLFTNQGIDSQPEKDWTEAEKNLMRVCESLKDQFLEIELRIKKIQTIIIPPLHAASQDFSMLSLQKLASDEHANALAAIESFEAKKLEIKNKVLESTQSFKLKQARFYLVELGLYNPMNDMLKKLSNKTTVSSLKEKTQDTSQTKSEFAPREQALIDFINNGLEPKTTATSSPLPDDALTQRIQDKMCATIGVRFLLLQKAYPNCFETELPGDFSEIGSIFAKKLLKYCVLARGNVDHQTKLTATIDARSASAFPPNDAPFRQIVESSIGMDLQTGLPLSPEDLAGLYPHDAIDSDLSESDDEGIDIDMSSFNPEEGIDPSMLALFESKKEAAARDTCSEGSEIEDFEKATRLGQ